MPRGVNGASRSAVMNCGALTSCQKAHHRVEMLDVPHLHHRPVSPRRRQHLLGLGERRANRFFDQEMAAFREQGSATTACWSVGTATETASHASPSSSKR